MCGGVTACGCDCVGVRVARLRGPTRKGTWDPMCPHACAVLCLLARVADAPAMGGRHPSTWREQTAARRGRFSSCPCWSTGKRCRCSCPCMRRQGNRRLRENPRIRAAVRRRKQEATAQRLGTTTCPKIVHTASPTLRTRLVTTPLTFNVMPRRRKSKPSPAPGLLPSPGWEQARGAFIIPTVSPQATLPRVFGNVIETAQWTQCCERGRGHCARP